MGTQTDNLNEYLANGVKLLALLFGQQMETNMDPKKNSGWRNFFAVNKKLLPLKITLFMFCGAAYAILPYLTIHMKDIGISDMDVGLIYSILPFCVFIGPPIVGFVADKIGDYSRVNMIFMVIMGVFHTALLFVPPTVNVISQPETEVIIRGSKFNIAWSECSNTDGMMEAIDDICKTKIHNQEKVSIKLNHCEVKCATKSVNTVKFMGQISRGLDYNLSYAFLSSG